MDATRELMGMTDAFPRLGLGTYRNVHPRECVESVRYALDLGYRHIDTAQTYENEAYVGEGIKEADVPREDVFLATKVDREHLAYEDVIDSTERSLDRLGVGYIDLLYIHWPTTTYDPAETLPAMDDLVDDGVIDHIGVSNFEPRHIEEAKEYLDAPIFANQIELHPLFPQEKLRAVGVEDGHWVVGYAPLGRQTALSHPVVESVADEAGATPAQVAIAWALSKERVGVIPKATPPERIAENYGALELELTEDQLERIDDIEEESREVDPDFAPWHR